MHQRLSVLQLTQVQFPKVCIRCQTLKSGLTRSSSTLCTDPDDPEWCLPVTAFELDNFSEVERFFEPTKPRSRVGDIEGVSRLDLQTSGCPA
jgi:hypothetical protein